MKPRLYRPCEGVKFLIYIFLLSNSPLNTHIILYIIKNINRITTYSKYDLHKYNIF